MKKIILSGFLVLLSSLSLIGVTSAAFEEKVSVLGTSFTIASDVGEPVGGGGTTGNTDLKILVSNSAAATGANLADSVNGSSFGDIKISWKQDFPIKIHNKGTKLLDIVGSANYINDPDTLRDDLFIEILAWNDANNNGTAEENEIGQSYGHDTILRFKNDTFSLGELGSASTKGYVLRFDGSGLSDANVGMAAVYDFVFTGVERVSQ